MKGSQALSQATSTTAVRAEPARRANRFRLEGRTVALDPRIHAVRRDIADIALAGVLFAPHYAQPHLRAVKAASTMVRRSPEPGGEATSQLLRGELFAVLDISRGWAWGYCLHDHYVGYVAAYALGAPDAPTHVVTAPLAPVFAAPQVRSPVTGRWPMGARLEGTEQDGFVEAEGGFMHRRHIRSLSEPEPEPVAVAERLVGTPYVWSGRAGDGLDCSGLVQLALGLAGIAAPRDADQQQALGTEVAPGEPLRRGDLVFFPGHVGLMVDAERIIHANSFWMAVTIEALAQVVARLAPEHPDPITARRRISA